MVAARAQLLLSLQRTAGNRAVCGEIQRLRDGLGDTRFLQRKVSIDNGKKWIPENGRLPKIPDHISVKYQRYVVDEVNTHAREWRDDATTKRIFASVGAFYQTLFDQVITQGQDATPTESDPWKTLKHLVESAGNLTEFPWSSLNAANAEGLKNELMECEVQRSSNPATTAFHGNTHGKLPKKVTGPDGAPLATLPPHEQPDHTPYIEFLITDRKAGTGIERGILDKESGQIYLTAHYDKGSIVWLSGAPSALVEEWNSKADQYCKEAKGE